MRLITPLLCTVRLLQLYAEIEQLKSRITELESQVHNRDYFAMMYELARDGESHHS